MNGALWLWLCLAFVLAAALDAQSTRPAAPAPGVAEMMKQADADLAAGRPADAVAALRRVAERAPTLPRGWYALGQAYNAIKQQALATLDARPEDAAWRQLV